MACGTARSEQGRWSQTRMMRARSEDLVRSEQSREESRHVRSIRHAALGRVDRPKRSGNCERGQNGSKRSDSERLTLSVSQSRMVRPRRVLCLELCLMNAMLGGVRRHCPIFSVRRPPPARLGPVPFSRNPWHCATTTRASSGSIDASPQSTRRQPQWLALLPTLPLPYPRVATHESI